LKRFRYQSRALPNFRDILPAAQDCFSTRPPRLYQTVLTFHLTLALQLPFPKISESMGNHDSKIVDAGSVD